MLALLLAQRPAAAISGKATFHTWSRSERVACPRPPSNLTSGVVALDASVFDTQQACDRCIRVRGSKGTVVLRVVDRCVGCGRNGVDIAKGSFPSVADIRVGRVDVRWDFVACVPASTVPRPTTSTRTSTPRTTPSPTPEPAASNGAQDIVPLRDVSTPGAIAILPLPLPSKEDGSKETPPSKTNPSTTATPFFASDVVTKPVGVDAAAIVLGEVVPPVKASANVVAPSMPLVGVCFASLQLLVVAVL